jgi:hypothetical protein
MSVSSAQRVVSQSPKSSYGTNWPAVWGIAGIVIVFIGVAIARQLWPTPAPEIEPARVAFRQRAPVATNPQRHAALVALQPTIELAAAEPTLDMVLRPAPTPRPSNAKAKTAGISDSRAKPAPDAAEAAEIAADEQPVKIKQSAKRGPLNAGLEEGWLGAADSRSPEDLALDLQEHSVELDLLSLPDGVKATPNVAEGRRQLERLMLLVRLKEVPDLAPEHPELRGFPFRRGAACRKTPEEAKAIQGYSIPLHQLTDRIPLPSLSEQQLFDFDPGIQQSRDAPWEQRLLQSLKTDAKFVEPTATSTLVQMLQHQDSSIRLQLTETLAAIESPAATAALAERAIYDLSPSVRAAACNELRSRPPRDYHQQLLAGLRYPWEPVAVHAAQALVALKLQDAIPDLNRMLELPDPNRPHQDDTGAWVKTEVVRVNHLRNCYLCHAPSTSDRDLVRGVVPIPGEPLPRMYYHDARGSFVRADVIYLKQDFSVVQEVAKADPWPKLQRFDYVVRTREATLAEIALANAPEAVEERNQNYPQREAVLNALQGLLETAADAPTERTVIRRDARFRAP